MASHTPNDRSVRPGTRKKVQFRDTRQGVVPNTIGALSRLTLDAATKAALTSAGAKLTVEIDTAGTRVFLADQRTGQLIGGPEDLERLGGIRSFVNRERKDAQGIEIAREVTQLAYKASLELASITPGFKQGPLEASYGAATRPLLAVIARIDDNRKKLDENTNDQLANVFKPMLKDFFSKIKNSYFRMILAHNAGQNTRGKLQELLHEAGVPEYVHTRLTAQGLVLDRAQELCRVLFPSDPSKGMSLTIKEWRDQDFLDKLGSQVLRTSALVKKLLHDDNFIRIVTKIDSSIDLTDETNPSVAKLLKCRVAVMPPMGSCSYVTDPAGKTKSGWKFPTPSMDSIQGAMSSLSTSLLRMYSANLQSVDLIGDYYATIVPGAVSRAQVSPTNNFYVQWANADDNNAIWFDRITGGEDGKARADVWRWLRTEMRLSEKAEGGKSLALALLLNEDGTPRDNDTRQIQKKIPDPADSTKTILQTEIVSTYPRLPAPTLRARALSDQSRPLNLDRELTATELPHWEQFQRVTFPSRKKGKKVSSTLGNTLTRLTPQGMSLVEEIKVISPHIATQMQQWLRGFSDERVQRAAVKLANASFDELFIKESEDSDDSSDDESEDEEES